MPLFGLYIMVDWSGAARRRGRRSDCIGIAHGPTEADGPLTDSPFSRTEAWWLRELGASPFLQVRVFYSKSSHRALAEPVAQSPQGKLEPQGF